MQSDYDNNLQNYFTDMEYLRDVFKNFVSAEKLPKRLIVLHGVGGVGKSSLLRMFRIHCKSVKVPVALASGDDAKSTLDVITRWMEDLKEDGVKFSALHKTLESYRTVQAKVEDQARKSQNKVADIAGKAASKTAEAAGGALVGAAIGSIVPGVGTAIGGMLGSAVGGMGAEALTDWLRGFLDKSSIDLLLDPAKKLTSDFLEDLAKAAEKKRIVLLLDTYEQMSALEDWVGEAAQKIHPNVLMVIAGRKLPDWNRVWSGWMMNAQVEELKPMTEDIMRELIHRYYATMRGGVPAPAQVDAIIKFARGLPMVVTSAVQLWVKYGVEDFQSVKAEIVANLVDRLMEGVPSALVPALEAAAVVRWFDQPILRAVLNKEDARDVYNELRRFPFVRSRSEGMALHDSVREMMDENLRVQDSERHAELHERAAVYFEKRLQKVEKENWENLVLERIYHRLKAERQSGTNLCVTAIEEAKNLYALSFGDLLVKELSNAKMPDVPFPQLLYAKGLMSLARNRFEDAISLFGKTLELHPPNNELMFKVTERLAYTLTLQGKLEDALQFYEECIRLSTDVQNPVWQINSWNGIETVLRRLGYIKRTIEVLRQSINTCKDIGKENSFEMAWAQDSLGIALRITGQWKQSIYHHQQALDIYNMLGNNYNAAIVLHNMTKNKSEQGYDSGQVINDFQKSLSVFEKFDDRRWIGYCKLDIAETLIGVAHFEEAEKIINTTENSDTTINVWINRLLGNIQQHREEWDNAIASYTKALHISEYQRRNQVKVGFLILLSSVNLSRNNLIAIPPLLEEAEQLIQQYEYNNHSASLRLMQGHIAWGNGNQDEAFTFYKHAMIYALRYNRFLLDELLSGRPQGTPLRPIIPYCLERGEEGKKILSTLRDWWEAGVNDVGTPRPDTISPIPEGIPLLEAEKIAREREPGDGSMQRSVVEQIEAAL